MNSITKNKLYLGASQGENYKSLKI